MCWCAIKNLHTPLFTSWNHLSNNRIKELKPYIISKYFHTIINIKTKKWKEDRQTFYNDSRREVHDHKDLVESELVMSRNVVITNKTFGFAVESNLQISPVGLLQSHFHPNMPVSHYSSSHIYPTPLFHSMSHIYSDTFCSCLLIFGQYWSANRYLISVHLVIVSNHSVLTKHV